ncbi:MAG TPA: HNH endonuclease [Steroidobacteraceae bacterium]|nr:HNH endonuclease [Steroidobacteraceae bacterium]
MVKDATATDPAVLLGEIAHIVAQSPGGPRRDCTLQLPEIDAYENLILLCHKCHETIDQQAKTYPVEKLLQFKKDHEEWVRTKLSTDERLLGLDDENSWVEERLSATLLPVSDIPHFVFSAPCKSSESEAKAAILPPEDQRVMTPFIIRGDRLYAFNDLRELSSPFSKLVDPYSAECHNALAWWDVPDKARWYVEILNRTLNKITGRKGLQLDKDHHRYYFAPDEPGQAKQVRYKSISGRHPPRHVVWNPKFKHSGELKPHWTHLAVALRFHRLGERTWALSVRPEHRFTKDGFTPLQPKTISRRSTKRKSRMYNLDVLQDVQFWRDYLSGSSPRIIARFGGGQALVIDNDLISTTVKWPAVRQDVGNRLQATYEDDLFSLADIQEIERFEDFESHGDQFSDEEEPDEGLSP